LELVVKRFQVLFDFKVLLFNWLVFEGGSGIGKTRSGCQLATLMQNGMPEVDVRHVFTTEATFDSLDSNSSVASCQRLIQALLVAHDCAASTSAKTMVVILQVDEFQRCNEKLMANLLRACRDSFRARRAANVLVLPVLTGTTVGSLTAVLGLQELPTDFRPRIIQLAPLSLEASTGILIDFLVKTDKRFEELLGNADFIWLVHHTHGVPRLLEVLGAAIMEKLPPVSDMRGTTNYDEVWRAVTSEIERLYSSTFKTALGDERPLLARAALLAAPVSLFLMKRIIAHHTPAFDDLDLIYFCSEDKARMHRS
jgi:hypothetical protein